MPPSRIGDFKVKIEDEEQKIYAEWTAPGDDFDHGTVAGKDKTFILLKCQFTKVVDILGYNFVVSEDVLSLINSHSQPAILHTIRR